MFYGITHGYVEQPAHLRSMASESLQQEHTSYSYNSSTRTTSLTHAGYKCVHKQHLKHSLYYSYSTKVFLQSAYLKELFAGEFPQFDSSACRQQVVVRASTQAVHATLVRLPLTEIKMQHGTSTGCSKET